MGLTGTKMAALHRRPLYKVPFHWGFKGTGPLPRLGRAQTPNSLSGYACGSVHRPLYKVPFHWGFKGTGPLPRLGRAQTPNSLSGYACGSVQCGDKLQINQKLMEHLHWPVESWTLTLTPKWSGGSIWTQHLVCQRRKKILTLVHVIV